MTTYFTAEYTCAVCGRTHKFRVVGSTNSFGSPDLDLRPAPMQRDTIHTWVQTCPDCGYSNGKIDRDTSVDKKWLSRESYRNCEGSAFVSGLAKKSIRHIWSIFMTVKPSVPQIILFTAHGHVMMRMIFRML